MTMESGSGGNVLPVGTILNGKWVILEFIAKGGMGEIYRAHQLNLKRDVAIKTVSREWLEEISEDPEELENALKRFRQEVLTMVQIRHPNVLQLYDYETAEVELDGETKEVEYIVLEYVPGLTLRDTMREEGFHPDDQELAAWMRRYFLPVIEGVKAIHSAGIFHRDIKPENVLMDGEIPKIADFGLARSCRMSSVTCSLEIKGTPAYMAPEQFIDFKRSDQRTDIYSLGKILYEAAAGRMPKNAVPFKQMALKQAQTPFFEAIDGVVRKATSEKPEDRYGSVEEFQAAVEAALAYVGERGPGPLPPGARSPGNRRVWPFVAALAVALVLAGSFWFTHYYGEHSAGQRPQAWETPVFPEGTPRRKPASDGVALILVPGGRFTLPPGAAGERERHVEVAPFYMDETPVTNHQFVNFLNSIGERVEAREGAVRDEEGHILIYLGEVVEGYEPIVYRAGRFEVKNSGHAACPVVRVTAYGAEAYARFYGRRLPTMAEWLYAAAEGRDPAGFKDSEDVFPASFFQKIELPFPVMLFQPNRFGLKGLNRSLGSWVLDARTTGEEGPSYVIVGGFDKGSVSGGTGQAGPIAVRRQPWEAFEEVGFRCVKDLDG